MLLALPAWAAPSLVGTIGYEEAHRALTIETTGAPVVRTKRLHNPDRLVIDLLDAELSGLANRDAVVPSRRIRGFRAVQYSLHPSVVRLIVELRPGVEPLVEVRQVAGRVTLVLADPPLPKGERDLETMPPADFQVAPPPTPAPTPTPLLGPISWIAATASPVPMPTPAPSVAPTPEPLAAWPSPEPTVTPPPEFLAPGSEDRVIARPRKGFGSTVMLRWQQVEALEDYKSPAGPVFAYPAGFNGVELRHWVHPWVGFGLDSRVLTYDVAAEGVHQNRTDLMVLPELVLRYPVWDGALEPEASLGYMGRHVTVLSTKPGNTLPFSPTQFYHGPALGLGVRWRLLPALSLGLQYQILPSVGGNLFRDFGSLDYGTVFPLFQSRYALAIMFDAGPAFVSLGYSDETSRNQGIGYTQGISGILLGAGLRY